MKKRLLVIMGFISTTLIIASSCLSLQKKDKYLCKENSKKHFTITNPDGTFEPDSYGAEGEVKLVKKSIDSNNTISKTLVDVRMISNANDKAYILYVEMDTVVATGAYGFDRVDSAYVFIKDVGPLKVIDLNISFSQLAELGIVTISGEQSYGYSTATFQGKYLEGNNQVTFSGSYCIDVYPED